MRPLALIVLILLLAGFIGRPAVANTLSDLVLTPVMTALECEARSADAEHVRPCSDKAPLTVPFAKCSVGVLSCQTVQLAPGADVTPVSRMPWQPAFRVYHSQFRPPREV